MWLKDTLKALTRQDRQPAPGELGYYMHVEIREKDGRKGKMGIVHVDHSKLIALKTPQGDTICLTFEGV
jgi:hypothetical protein